MNKLSKLIAVSVVGLSSSAMVVTFAASANANNNPIISGAQAVSYNTRRIFLVNTVENYWQDDNWYIRTWTGTGANIKYTKATRLMDDYNKGLYYCDITYPNASEGVSLLVRHNADDDDDAWEDYEATTDVALPAVGNESVIFVNDTVAGNKRGTSLGTAGMSDGQLAYLLTLYDSCSSSNVNGYNSYPQLEADILGACSEWVLNSDTHVGTETYDSKAVTVKQKVAELEYRYSLHK